MMRWWLLSILVPVVTFANPAKVIKTVGPNEPIAPFMADITMPAVQPKSINLNKPYQFNFTTTSKDLTVGPVKTRKINAKNLIQPIFIVGTDKESMKWLKHYAPRLKALHAVGIVVNVKDNKAYEKLAKTYGLHLLPISGDTLAKHFGIQHYPVLISQHLIEQ